MGARDNLLIHLKSSMGEWVSGELLSTKLDVSRAAISKHVRTLRKQGYEIDSRPRKGYLLTSVPDLLLPNEIREGLDTRVFGQKEIVCLQHTDSTNLDARRLAEEGAPEGTVVVADTQTAGRGRKGRSWYSPPGFGIYTSIILRPAISPADAPRITLLTAVAIAEALLELTDIDIRIKWPNDILANGKKAAGILTEIRTEMDMVDYIVVGLGLNVNTPDDQFEELLKPIATSLFIESGEKFPRVKIIQTCLKWFERCYESAGATGFAPVIDRWKALSKIIGQKIEIDVAGRIHSGRVKDVDNAGVLVMLDDHGKERRFFSGDVTMRPT